MHNYSEYEDFSINTEDTSSSNCFIRITRLRKQDLQHILRKAVKKYQVIGKNIPGHYDSNFQLYFKDLIDFEDKNKYRYKIREGKKKYSSRYALRIELLLPRKISRIRDKRRFVHNYLYEFSKGTYHINYIAYEIKRGKGSYIQIILSERDFINKEIVKKRKSNSYLNKETGRSCAASNPNAILHKKRGDALLDKDGKEIKELVMFSDKNRVFIYQNMKEFQTRLRDIFIIVTKKILGKVKKRLHIKTKRVMPWWHQYMRKNYQKYNNAKKMVEYFCNYAIEEELKLGYEETYVYSHARMRDYIPKNRLENIKEIKSIFYHFKARLEACQFTNTKGEIVVINPRMKYKGSLKQFEENIDNLSKMLVHDLSNVNAQLMSI